jgi:hypothetical protein
MMNDALRSGAIDIASGGMPGLLTIWAMTKGTAQEVRGVAAMSAAAVAELSQSGGQDGAGLDGRRPDRVPAVKVSARAVLLEMAAAREWGGCWPIRNSNTSLRRVRHCVGPISCITQLPQFERKNITLSAP